MFFSAHMTSISIEPYRPHACDKFRTSSLCARKSVCLHFGWNPGGVHYQNFVPRLFTELERAVARGKNVSGDPAHQHQYITLG